MLTVRKFGTIIDSVKRFRTYRKDNLLMTDMKRVTISLPDDIDRKVLELRKDDRFVRCSYSELVRMLLEAGLSETVGRKKGKRNA